ncbi:TonB-dependent receptor plug domain-containing protein [Flavivirga spongiicola]|uniref:TonB-dependent receptor n=1 Tax=Flavivirga spongiicola TaxID=421621 RepID=A0ABU7XXM1_9FLAO|nr:TonB-dependent receptor plug domain-containing protein [Flavivirga sp. MEBiC05379]MDO5980543.1 TonB-dependent receptor [Flavivirga sp. MEBiC05379]
MKFKLTILIFLFSLTMMSQKKTSLLFNNTPLNEVIIELEKKFDIKISFNSELINNQVISFRKEDTLLKDVINAIEGQINIAFEKVTERYYILKRQAVIDLSQTQNLDEVVISEYLTSGINKKKDGSILLSPSSLGILPGLTEPDVLQSLQLLPGVQSPSETASGLYIRGGTPDQNLILWDGIKMYHSGHFFGMISAFNPYITKDVKLYTSGTRAKYGNRISGVIDITSSNKIPKKTEGGMGFNMTHVDAYLKTPISEKFALIVSARRSFTDFINTFTFNNLTKRVFQNTSISIVNNNIEEGVKTTKKDLFYFSDVTLKAIIQPSVKDNITFSTLFTKNKLNYEFLLEGFGETNDKLDIVNQGLSSTWSHQYNSVLSHTFQTYYSRFNIDYLGKEIFSEDESTETIKKNEINDFGISLQTDLKLNSKSTILGGYQFSSNKVGYTLGYKNSLFEDNGYEDTKSGNNITSAFYLEYQYKKQKKWYLNLGLRANNISVLNMFLLEPRVYFEKKLSPHFKVKLSAEQINQAISQIVEFNTSSFGLENQIWTLVDGESIPLLKSNQVSVGFNFNKNGWNLDLDFYSKNITGLTSDIRGFNNININFSEGKSDVLGADFLLKKKIENYRTWLSYSIMKNDFVFDDLNEGKKFPGNFHIVHQLTWSHTYKWNAFDFSLGWNFRTNTPYTKGLSIDDDGFTINYGPINGVRLPNYHRLDFSSTYKFNFSENKKWKGKLGFSLLNLYNNKSLLSRTYKIRPIFTEADVTYALQKVDKISLGITPNLVFRVEF